MEYLILDVEATTRNKGDPFDSLNKLVLVGLLYDDVYETFVIEHNECCEPYNKKLQRIQELINQAKVLVGFNIKFDIHWLRRYGISIPDVKIWDVQVAHFIDTSQGALQPPAKHIHSLNEACAWNKVDSKFDYIKENYWDKGIDSVDIPLLEFTNYLKQDLNCTNQCRIKQQERINEAKQRLIWLQGLDLLALEEMEYNGIRYDVDSSRAFSNDIGNRVLHIDNDLLDCVGGARFINFGSGDHKSVILYGGVINEEVSRPYIKKDGTVSSSRSLKNVVSHTFPRLVDPLRGSELKKKGFYATDEGTFKKLKAKGKAKKIIDLLLKRTELQKANGTYYKGIPDLMESHNWGSYIHGNLNQCVAVTGRLSSNRPNLQNNPEEINQLFRSRYG